MIYAFHRAIRTPNETGKSETCSEKLVPMDNIKTVLGERVPYITRGQLGDNNALYCPLLLV